MTPTGRWRQLLSDRLREAATMLGQTQGVHGLLIRGSVGCGDGWPLSEIDPLPIYTDLDAATELDRDAQNWSTGGQHPAASITIRRLAGLHHYRGRRGEGRGCPCG